MKQQRGFTLVELMIAAAFLGFIVTFATVAFVQINQAYNRGITVKRTQESTRDIIQEIATTIQAADYSDTGTSVVVIDTGTGPNYLCVGNVRYIWMEGVGQPFSLKKDFSFGVCNDGSLGGDEADLLNPNLAIQELEVKQLASSIAFQINLIVSVNESDVQFLTGSGAAAQCNVLNGDQYCDIASLTTVVTLRR